VEIPLNLIVDILALSFIYIHLHCLDNCEIVCETSGIHKSLQSVSVI
jgi:hypothetical protein